MSKSVKLFNTLSREIEQLQPMEPGIVTLYCCGPTVYNYQHIGNLRTYIFEDLLVRTLRYAGYQMKHVMNITDVGHLVSDADEGEDKMLVASKREKKSSAEIAAFYSEIFFEHCAWLNITQPDIICKATEHISQMIALIERLFARGMAYQSGGNVYFDVARLPDYGKLANLDLENLMAGARIEVDQKKRNALDFALWFTQSKFENQELQWDSPWGRGYPGWHIECSAMSMTYLGECFDIHCGGIDHIPVHHTNEIAQSEGATGKPFVKIWMHGGFLLTEKEKMSKSKGEFLTLDRLKERGLDPICYRLFCLSGHYRKELAFRWEAVQGAQASLKKLKNAVCNWKQEALKTNVDGSLAKQTERTRELQGSFEEAIFNDLGLPKALALFHELVNDEQLSPQEKIALAEKFDSVLGLGVENWQTETLTVPEEILQLLQVRESARKTKDWKLADEARDKILAAGFLIEDTKDGPKVKSQR